MNFSLFNKKKVEERNAEALIPPYFSDGMSFSQLYNRWSAMNLSAVYRATEIISDSVAILPIEVKKGTEPINSNLDILFKSGVKNMTKYEFIKMLIQSVILKGNGFAYIERSNGIVTNLRYIEAQEVTINYNKQSNEVYYTTQYVKGRIPQKDMIHLIKNSYDGVNGVSVLSYAARTLGLSHNVENAASNFFGKGCCLAGVIEVAGHTDRQQKIDAKQSFINAYTQDGSGISVLGDNMSYKPIQISNNDAQLLESRLFNVQDIARFFGISPVLLGDLSKSGYNTIEATQQQFLLHTLQPYINMIEEEFTNKLCDEGETINFKETYLLKTDKQAQANYLSTLITNGILTINEARKELGYGEIEGGDKNLIPFTDIEQNTVK